MSRIAALLAVVALIMIGWGLFYEPIRSGTLQDELSPPSLEARAFLPLDEESGNLSAPDGETPAATITEEATSRPFSPTPTITLTPTPTTSPSPTMLPPSATATATRIPTLEPSTTTTAQDGQGSALLMVEAAPILAAGDTGASRDPDRLSSAAAAAAGNTFAFSFFDAMPRAFDNYAYSPPGLFWSLFLLADGSEGETRSQLLGRLGLSPYETITCQSALALFQTGRFGNFSLWGGEWIAYSAPFLNALQRCYGVVPGSLVLDGGEEVEGWIEALGAPAGVEVELPPFGPDEGLITAHVAGFANEESLLHQGRPVRISRAPFHSLGGGAHDINYLQVEMTAPLYTAPEYDAVFLPYAEGIDMMVARPKSFGRLSDTLKEVSQLGVDQVYRQAEPRWLRLKLPAFTAGSTANYADLIINQGAPAPFFPGVAELQAEIPTGEPFVSGVYSILTVDFSFDVQRILSQAPSGENNPSGIGGETEYAVDKAFVFLLIDKENGWILAVGQVVSL